ncbi:N-acetyltaurine hydrolase-like [Amphiura filiformis]|uniref:N-acetyltaurine hydrolase-like n=1 Tax=Amphiura filiformis TaxID=82378 RepID=UPI003B20D9ED
MATDDLIGKIQTVSGPINPFDLGFTMTHEHFQFSSYWKGKRRAYHWRGTPDWVKKKQNEPIRLDNLWWIRQYPYSNIENVNAVDEYEAWDEEINFYLQNGGRSIVDASCIGIGRDVKVLKRLQDTTGVNIIAGTGWYVNATHPREVEYMTEEELVNRMVEEITVGADGSTTKCGVIGEIGCTWPLRPREKKVLRATAAAQTLLGCPVLIHPGRDVTAPREILRVLQEAGGNIGKTVMSHMDRCVTTTEQLLDFASLGSYVEFDLFGWEVSNYQMSPDIDFLSDAQRIAFFQDLLAEGYEDKMVMSHDIHRKCQLMKYGGHGFSHILLNVIPKMLRKGITQNQIDKITIQNPRRWLTFEQSKSKL